MKAAFRLHPLLWLALVGLLDLPAWPAVDEFHVYWADYNAGRIQRARLDGSEVMNIVAAGVERPVQIALDVADDRMYWTDFGFGQIGRAHLDGSEVEHIVSGLANPFAIALDPVGGKVYWSDLHTLANDGEILRANLDGSAVEVLVGTALHVVEGLAVDPGRGHLYWADIGMQRIERANLDGSARVELAIDDVGSPLYIALDLEGGKIYWTDYPARKIRRANLDGTGTELLMQATGWTPTGLALYLDENRMYFTTNHGQLHRASLDATHQEPIVVGLTTPFGVALDLPPDPPPQDVPALSHRGVVAATVLMLIMATVSLLRFTMRAERGRSMRTHPAQRNQDR